MPSRTYKENGFTLVASFRPHDYSEIPEKSRHHFDIPALIQFDVTEIPEEHQVEWSHDRENCELDSFLCSSRHENNPSRSNLGVDVTDYDPDVYDTSFASRGWDTAYIAGEIPELLTERTTIDLEIFICGNPRDVLQTLTVELPPGKAVAAVNEIHRFGVTEAALETIGEQYGINTTGVEEFLADTELFLPPEQVTELRNSILGRTTGQFTSPTQGPNEQNEGEVPVLTTERSYTSVHRRYRPDQQEFRQELLDAYGGRCAVCDWECRSLETGNPLVEAPHIRPVEVGGASNVSNGMLLCPNCHQLFDNGVFSLTDDYRMIINPDADATTKAEVEPYEGEQIHLPPDTSDRPAEEQLQWHRENHNIVPPNE